MKSNTKWFTLAILVFLIWGTQHPPIKILSEEISPFLLNFLRFFIAWLVLLPIMLRKKVIPIRKDLLKIGSLGLIGIALYGIFVVYGIQLSTSTNSAILINANPLFIALLAPFLIGESVSLKKALGILLGFLGVLMVVSNGFKLSSVINSEFFTGNLLLTAAALCVAIFAIYNKPLIKKYDGFSVTFYAVTAGSILLFLLAAINGELSGLFNLSLYSIGLVAYVAVVTTALTWVIWFDAIKRIGVVSTSSFFFLIPISGIISSYFWLGEGITAFTVLGAALILSGIYVVQKANKN